MFVWEIIFPFNALLMVAFAHVVGLGLGGFSLSVGEELRFLLFQLRVDLADIGMDVVFPGVETFFEFFVGRVDGMNP